MCPALSNMNQIILSKYSTATSGVTRAILCENSKHGVTPKNDIDSHYVTES